MKCILIITILSLFCSCTEPTEPVPDVHISTTMGEYHREDTVVVIISNELEEKVSFDRCLGYIVYDLQKWDGRRYNYLGTFPFTCGSGIAETLHVAPHGTVDIALLGATAKYNSSFTPGIHRLAFRYWSSNRAERFVYSNRFEISE